MKKVPKPIGVTVLCTGKHYRKIAIIDNKLLWEGSLESDLQNVNLLFFVVSI